MPVRSCSAVGSARNERRVLGLREHLADVEPAEHDVRQIRLNRRQREQPVDLASGCRPSCQAAVGGRRHQLGIRQRSQQRERQLAGDLVRRQRRVGVLPARVGGRRRPELRAVDEGRRNDDRLDHQLDAGLVVLHRPLRVDLHQVGHLAGVDRSPVGLLGEGETKVFAQVVCAEAVVPVQGAIVVVRSNRSW